MATEAIGTEVVRPDDPTAPRRRIQAPEPAELVPVAVLIVGCAITALSFESSWLALAYRLPRMHAVIDTTIGLVSVALAYLVYGRVRALGRRRDAVLAFGLGFSGLVNLFAAVSQGVATQPLGRYAVWTQTLGRLVVAVLFAVSALLPAVPLKHEPRVPKFAAAIVIGFVAQLLIGGALAPLLPWSQELAISPKDASKPLFVGPALLLVVQVLILIAYSAAAAGFSRRRVDDGDLMSWFASSSMLFALASLDYLTFPSIFSDWIYVGDLLRLAGVLLLLVGAAREISSYWRTSAAMEERRRLAHDLHDGVAQELAYIAAVARRLEASESGRDARRLADAAQHALDESRLVISTLAGAGNACDQIALTARDAAHRFDLSVVLDLPLAADLPAPVSEALLRIVREAINNIGRHAAATTVRVLLRVDSTLTLTIRDDGVGFNPSNDTAGFGLMGMRERAEAMGGSFHIASAPGHGTTIEVIVPWR